MCVPAHLAWRCCVCSGSPGLEVLCVFRLTWSGGAMCVPTHLAWRCYVCSGSPGLEVLCVSQLIWPGDAVCVPAHLAWRCCVCSGSPGLEVLCVSQLIWPGGAVCVPAHLAWRCCVCSGSPGLEVLCVFRLTWPGGAMCVPAHLAWRCSVRPTTVGSSGDRPSSSTRNRTASAAQSWYPVSSGSSPGAGTGAGVGAGAMTSGSRCSRVTPAWLCTRPGICGGRRGGEGQTGTAGDRPSLSTTRGDGRRRARCQNQHTPPDSVLPHRSQQREPAPQRRLTAYDPLFSLPRQQAQRQ